MGKTKPDFLHLALKRSDRLQTVYASENGELVFVKVDTITLSFTKKEFVQLVSDLQSAKNKLEMRKLHGTPSSKEN
jgi:flagellar biosynthesis regulator FlaF